MSQPLDNRPAGAVATAPRALPAVERDSLQTIELSKSFGGVLAVDHVSFDARGGEVHGILGENGAGKSTFIKLLCGAVAPDGGEIRLGGVRVSPHRAGRKERQIAAIFQELSLVPDLTVGENVWLEREPVNWIGTVSNRKLFKRTSELFERLGIDGIDPRREVRSLSVADRHLVEAAKVLSTGPRVVIFDEATSALGPRETQWMLDKARELAVEGRIVLFISHRLNEMREVSDSLTVFRGGHSVGTRTRESYDEDELVSMMLDRKLTTLYPPRRAGGRFGDVALRVRGLKAGTRLRGADFDLRQGEILGVGGLQGQGQTQLFLGLYGMLRPDEGTIEVAGERMRGRRHALALPTPLALVPEDRRHQGLLLQKSLRENVTLAVLDRLSRFGVIDKRQERNLVRDAIERLQIAAKGSEQEVRWLSGGNQQKVVIAKLLLTKARILLLFDLTRGVDVGTKANIFALMRQLAEEGFAMLFYSTDASELAHMADRVVVMYDGRTTAVLEGDDLDEETIVRAAVQGAQR